MSWLAVVTLYVIRKLIQLLSSSDYIQCKPEPCMPVIANKYHHRITLEACRLQINTQNATIHSRIEASWFKLGGITDQALGSSCAINNGILSILEPENIVVTREF